MLKFISFGSGSSGNCYYLFTPTDGLVIDVGLGLRTLKKHFREYGLSLANIHNIIVTHDHADHIKSVGAMSIDLKVPVYATKKVHEGIERNYCVQKKVPRDMVRCLEKGQTVKIGEFEVTPFEVPHDSLDNVGYRIAYGDTVFCIITDAGRVTEEMKTQIGDANYIVMEANYDDDMLMGGPYPQYLKHRISSGTGHLSEENNPPELARKTVETALKNSPCHAAAEAELVVLKRKTPTGIYELEL